jgi:putative ABC transport system permease protein
MNAASRASVTQAFASMAASPLRSILCTLGIVIGIAAVIATLALTEGIQKFTREQISALTDVQSISVSPKFQELRDGFAYPTRRHPRFSAFDASDLRRSVSPGAEITMSAGGTAVVTSATAAPHVAALTATLANFLRFGRRDVVAGRFFTEIEALHGTPVAVLSNRLAREMSPDGNAAAMLGREVRVRGTSLSVIGVMPAYTGEASYQVIVPIRLGGKLLGLRDRLEPTLIVRAPTLEALEATKQDVIAWAASRYRDWEHQVSITTQLGRFEQTMTAMRIMQLVLGSLAAISLLVGGVGIMNVLLAGVAERTREIGVRKALGARKRDILYQFLAEAVAMSSVGSGVGTLIGLAGAFGVAAGVRRLVPGAELHAAVTIGTILFAVSAAAIIGLTFGTFPALRAARLSPIDAIRHET